MNLRNMAQQLLSRYLEYKRRVQELEQENADLRDSLSVNNEFFSGQLDSLMGFKQRDRERIIELENQLKYKNFN